MLPDIVVLSVNENADYLSVLPVTVRSWRKFFPEVQIIVGIVGRTDVDIPECEVMHFPIVAGVDTVNQARVLRYYIASLQGERIVTIHDVDSVIMEREFFTGKLKDFVRDSFFALGYDVHPVKGKFPAGYATALGNTWADVVGMRQMFWDWKEFVNHQTYLPSRANILLPAISPSDPLHGFCDETWLMLKLTRWVGTIIDVPFEKKNWARITTARNFFIDNSIEIHHMIPRSAFEGQYKMIEEHLQ